MEGLCLHNINFSESRETVGIIGSTGSGKTSLVNLIPRFYDCNKGEVLIDGINVKGTRTSYITKSNRHSNARCIFIFEYY